MNAPCKPDFDCAAMKIGIAAAIAAVRIPVRRGHE